MVVKNQAFVDGNKRIAHAAMEVFLVLNGYEVRAQVEEQEAVMGAIASGKMEREELARWIEAHMVRIGPRG